MAHPRVYVTRKLPGDALERLANAVDLRCWPESAAPVPREVLLAEAAQAEGLLTVLSDRIDEAVLTAAPHLKVVANMAVGYDNIDVAAAARRGVTVTNTPGVLDDTTADLAFALMLAAARRLPEAERRLRQGEWAGWAPLWLAGTDVHGATLGIVGFGRIGQAMARRARGFGMRILYHSHSAKPAAAAELGAEYRPLADLLIESDFVSLHVPLTAETRGLIGPAELAQMKPGAILINTARGAVVDEIALAEALREGRLAAAGIDVYSTEPVPMDHPLLALPNVVALPHIGSASVATRTRMAAMAAADLLAVLAGRAPLNPVVPVPRA
ncbi:MAG: 2-hydroxyacid dehydrogenase [Symbiobacteriia bacterium]